MAHAFATGLSAPHVLRSEAALGQLKRNLKVRNQAVTRSLAEGREETLTLHQLAMFAVFGAFFKTTNCLESMNV
ncbi:MAG: hypothetical protein MRJ67_02870 [Nitrospirales bacterium]|nr:hypothetical protein [Nitrospira sp.]MDR4459451.1 hypothetical protein [Nitrospirales bacterium]MDR4484921.1 hypothetical protein [Nitrospirales bacterium]